MSEVNKIRLVSEITSASLLASDLALEMFFKILYGASDFKDTTRNIEHVYNEALAIYHVSYDYAKQQNDIEKMWVRIESCWLNTLCILSEDSLFAGSLTVYMRYTRPPILDKTDFASWQQRIRLYCRGKQNGVNILKSIDEGPFQMGTFLETLTEGTEGAPNLGPERPRVYSDLSPEDKERTSSNTRNQATVQDGRVVVRNVQGRQNRGQGNNARGGGAAGYGGAQNRVGNANPGQTRKIKCYNCNGICQIARNYTQPKRLQNSEYFKDKMLLMQAQENGVALDEEQLLFIGSFY
ncbi:hypothetical protein Tco_0704048 [Tanacetum coccineum]|uniref:RDRP C-terminal head domain-containing protein n=1 Tax=Tanacetum coccineum TaxID=301880 RepID=A0ABQ4Y1D3_9ASTR